MIQPVSLMTILVIIEHVSLMTILVIIEPVSLMTIFTANHLQILASFQ